MSGYIHGASTGPAPATLGAAQKQMAAARIKISRLEAELKTARADKNRMHRQLKEAIYPSDVMAEENAAYKREVEELSEQLEEAKENTARIAELEKKVHEAESEVQRLRSELVKIENSASPSEIAIETSIAVQEENRRLRAKIADLEKAQDFALLSIATPARAENVIYAGSVKNIHRHAGIVRITATAKPVKA